MNGDADVRATSATPEVGMYRSTGEVRPRQHGLVLSHSRAGAPRRRCIPCGFRHRRQTWAI